FARRERDERRHRGAGRGLVEHHHGSNGGDARALAAPKGLTPAARTDRSIRDPSRCTTRLPRQYRARVAATVCARGEPVRLLVVLLATLTLGDAWRTIAPL